MMIRQMDNHLDGNNVLNLS